MSAKRAWKIRKCGVSLRELIHDRHLTREKMKSLEKREKELTKEITKRQQQRNDALAEKNDLGDIPFE
jgi:hypothetical protein